jgi:hypothetical protein
VSSYPSDLSDDCRLRSTDVPSERDLTEIVAVPLTGGTTSEETIRNDPSGRLTRTQVEIDGVSQLHIARLRSVFARLLERALSEEGRILVSELGSAGH